MKNLEEKLFPTAPWPWQRELRAQNHCNNQLIRIPTGFGKTLGVLHAWLHHHFADTTTRWPTRLVWCLPMRVLVEQTEAEIKRVLIALGLEADVDVHVLMGGVEGTDWSMHPERRAILIGTQDMLLSRALNRGYAAARARWPLEFGLLSQDCLWVMDEVQLMDVGLATSAQLQAFWDQDAEKGKAIWPNKTWWMSATLQREWLEKSPDTTTLVQSPPLQIPASDRTGKLWDDVEKPLQPLLRINPKDLKNLGRTVADDHLAAGNGLTLVILNTVQRALDLFNALQSHKGILSAKVDCRLVHSRFRPAERLNWRTEFLNRGACEGNINRIIVTTQVIEAGVDISAHRLYTELAPWPSLVQRFGRCARWGGHAVVTVVDLELKEKAALPYDAAELDSAARALSELTDVAPLALEAFEEHLSATRRAELYPYAPLHLLLRYEIDELFDTAADLSGSDIDISRFIRSGDERDLQVFWVDIPKEKDAAPDSKRKPARNELCSVPVGTAKKWLLENGKSKLNAKSRAWVWDYLDAKWNLVREENLFPGQVLLVSSDTGGYDLKRGFDALSKSMVLAIPSHVPTPAEQFDGLIAARVTDDGDHENSEALSQTEKPIAEGAEAASEELSWRDYQTIASHGAQVGDGAVALCKVLMPDKSAIFSCVGRWHDVGKVHPAFSNSIKCNAQARPKRVDLAKAPKVAWERPSQMYQITPNEKRQGFRHELASTLALFDVLRRHNPMHTALLGSHLALLQMSGIATETQACATEPPNTLEAEILGLSAEDFDLVAYLVCCHHGKVRVSWHASAFDQDANDTKLRIRGVRDGEFLPALVLMDSFGNVTQLPESQLVLAPSAIGLSGRTGRSWTDRVLGLLRKYGPFTLSYFEAIIIAADRRASKAPLLDPLLENTNDQTASYHPSLASAAARGAATPSMGGDSAQRGDQHGLRGGAGGSSDFGSGTRAPPAATRFLETTRGNLSYLQLAPLLAARAAEIERDLFAGVFNAQALDTHLIAALQTRLCQDLTPQLVGIRRVNVLVGAHEPPHFTQVRAELHIYSLDLQTRVAAAVQARGSVIYDERLIETLAFAEGRLLYIHPFADFNGRTTRLFLALLLKRLDLPRVALVPPPERARSYLDALAAADLSNYAPLAEIWHQRFEQAGARL